jgi:hypothetical protein
LHKGVRPRLKNNADYPDWATDLVKLQTFIKFGGTEDFAYRVVEFNQAFDARTDIIYLAFYSTALL